LARHGGGGRVHKRNDRAGHQTLAVLAISMTRDEVIVSFVAAAFGGWFAAVARELKNERRRISWRMIALETPGAIVCGLIGGGMAMAFNLTHPLTVAAFASVAGHLGSAVIMQLVVAIIQKRNGQ
jgi:uncharacterized membrane protein YeiB